MEILSKKLMVKCRNIITIKGNLDRTIHEATVKRDSLQDTIEEFIDAVLHEDDGEMYRLSEDGVEKKALELIPSSFFTWDELITIGYSVWAYGLQRRI